MAKPVSEHFRGEDVETLRLIVLKRQIYDVFCVIIDGFINGLNWILVFFYFCDLKTKYPKS